MPEGPNNFAPRRQDALFSWIQQFAPYGVITLDESFLVQSWNHWMELHGPLQSKDVVGKNIFSLFPDLRGRKLASYFERALQGESSVLSTSLHNYLLPLPSSYRETSRIYMLQTARITPLFSNGKVCGMVLVIEDVTQREAQAEILRRQHRRDELLSWILAQLLKTDQPRRTVRQLFFKIVEQLEFDTFLIYLWNDESEKLGLEAFGGVSVESEKDFVDCPFVALLPVASREIAVFDSIAENRTPGYAALRKAGMSAAVVIPLFANDRHLGLLCFGTGTRESILAEESDLLKIIGQYLATALDRENTSQQLLKAKEVLSQQAQLLEKSVQERTASLRETISELETFSYTIAHDLKAPTRATYAYCQVLIEDFSKQLPADARLIIEKIAKASSRMEILTRDLLEFSKISRQAIQLSWVEIEPVIEDVIALNLPAIRETVTILAPLHPVQAHRGLLQHVFSNLIDNAVKFVRPGGTPKITISSEIVSLASPNTRSQPLLFSSTAFESRATETSPGKTLSPDRIRIWVRDEGIGIPPEAYQKIFGIFERGVVSELYQGTGIGLAIVARAMQRMGGTCGVESEPGQGSGFWIELPAA